MTETPNTAAIRAAWGSYDYHVPTPWEDVAALCDALDAARAANAIDGPAQLARAEAAESRIVELDLLIGMMRDDNNAVHDTAVHHAARAEAAEVAFHKTARELVASEMRAEAAEAARDHWMIQAGEVSAMHEAAEALAEEWRTSSREQLRRREISEAAHIEARTGWHEAEVRAQAAEARIARALEAIRVHERAVRNVAEVLETSGHCSCYGCSMARALTEGTGQ